MLDQRPKESIQNGQAPKLNLSRPQAKSQSTAKSEPGLKSLQQLPTFWKNLGFRWKLTALLVLGAAIPTILVTQIEVGQTEKILISDLQKNLDQNLNALADTIADAQSDYQTEASIVAQEIEESISRLPNPQVVLAPRTLVQALLELGNEHNGFVIVTDAQGRVVSHNIKATSSDLSQFPPLPAPNEIAESKYTEVNVAPGTFIGDLPILKAALTNQRTLTGVELIKPAILQRLGLESQAAIGIRPQTTQGLPEPKQPFPENTYDTEQGKAGLTIVAVQPIKVQNRVVGTVLVGKLLNRNYDIVDLRRKRTGSRAVFTIFAQDWRVSTNVPYSDKQTRAIGTRVAREVASKVLNEQGIFTGETNIVGLPYLTAYGPLYDHQKTLNPAQAKPIGMTFVGEPESQISEVLQAQGVIGYGVGGSILLLAVIVALPIAGSFSRPLKRLTEFSQQIGSGQMGMRLVTTDSQDEIGALTQSLNQMAGSIESNLKAAQFQAEIASRVRAADDLSEVLQRTVEGAREILNVDRVVIYRFHPDGRGYVQHEDVLPGLPIGLNGGIEDACIPEALLEAYKEGRVVPTADVYNAGFHPEHLKLMDRLQIKANLVTPIVTKGQLFGLLVAHHCRTTHLWQESEIGFLRQLAIQTGLSLDRVGFLEQQQAEAEQQRQAKEQLQRRALELLIQVDPISRGDLTVRASVTEDEIGTVADSYNATVGSLRKIVSQVQAAAQQVATTTNSSEVSVQTLSAEAVRQAEDIAAALERIEEMSTSIRLVAANAEQAEIAVQQASQTVREGDNAMNRTVEGILAIRETVAETSKKVKRLGESSQKISKVVNLISSFADQTNLLALNAAIEAARAGEEGRGFAVVADEVRALARQSADATADIEKLVAEIQTETNEVVAAMESGTEQVVAGTKLVDDARQNLTKIAAASTQINTLVTAIAEAAAAQSQASEAVTQTMTDVAEIAGKTSVGATQVSSSFKELLEVAQELQATVGKFKVS